MVQNTPRLARSAIFLALNSKFGGKITERTRWDFADETAFDQLRGERGQSLGLLPFDFAQDLLDHPPVFQPDGQEDDLHRPGMSQADWGK